MLERRKAARARLAARQDAKGQQEQGKLEARVTELAERVKKKEAAVRKREKQASDRLAGRARKIAAGQRPGGTCPIASIDEDREVKRSRKALADARAAWQEAVTAAAAPAAGPDAKVNAADPSSLVMPLKKGGSGQLRDVQALPGHRPHPGHPRRPAPPQPRRRPGPGAPLLGKTREVLPAAGITGQIRKALSGAGYASDASFTLGTTAQLHIAVTREARQAGRSGKGRAPQAMLPSWQDMTARLDTPEGRQLCKQRAGTIKPVFAQLTARLGRTLNYRGDPAGAELALWAASHNTLKAIKARARRLARTATAPALTAA